MAVATANSADLALAAARFFDLTGAVTDVMAAARVDDLRVDAAEGVRAATSGRDEEDDEVGWR